MKKIFFLLLLIYSFKTFSLELTISQGTIKPTPIAITDLYAINNNMTKIGSEGLTKRMAIDLAKHNIRVNTVCPTFVETPMVKKFFKNKKFKKSVINNIPLKRIATESDVATAVVYLASNASSMITGSSLMIDGCWTAK